jgi:hypothetical protein
LRESTIAQYSTEIARQQESTRNIKLRVSLPRKLEEFTRNIPVTSHQEFLPVEDLGARQATENQARRPFKNPKDQQTAIRGPSRPTCFLSD